MCCNLFIILYADHRIVSQVYFEDYEISYGMILSGFEPEFMAYSHQFIP